MNHPDPHQRRLSLDALDRYLAGEGTQDDVRLVTAWMADHPNDAPRIQRLLNGGPALWNTELAVVELRRLLNDEAQDARVPSFVRPPEPGLPSLRAKGRRGHWVAWTGAALAVVGVVLAQRFATPHTALQPAKNYTTVAGQQATITLANGTRAILGPSTTLSVATNAADAGTTVTVSGQVLFTVHHQSRAPFTVRTGNAVARVLGTTFLVRRYPTDQVARVFVTEGRVSLQGIHRAATTDAGAVLTANTLGVVDDSGQIRVTPNVTTDEYTGWAKGELVFQKTPVGEIVAELARAYGADIRLTDSTLAAQTLTWTVPVTEKSLTSVLHALAVALDAHVTRSGDVIRIVPGPSRARKTVDPRITHTLESQYGR